jgi:hypothetical protein
MNMAPCIRVKITDIWMVNAGGIFFPQVDTFLSDYAASHTSSRLYTLFYQLSTICSIMGLGMIICYK